MAQHIEYTGSQEAIVMKEYDCQTATLKLDDLIISRMSEERSLTRDKQGMLSYLCYQSQQAHLLVVT